MQTDAQQDKFNLLIQRLEERSKDAKELANKMRDLGYHEAARLFRIEAQAFAEAIGIAMITQRNDPYIN